MMVERGDADGMVTGLRLNYPETVRPPLEILGLSPGAKVAVGMYMMVQQNAVKFFGDTVFNIDPDAETLADITVQMADAVQGFGVTPRVAMISYSNFGAVRHPDVTRIHRALEIVRDRRPDLEIDGEMQPEIALDPVRRQQSYGFSRLTQPANTLVFSSLAVGQRRLPDRPRDRRRVRRRPDPARPGQAGRRDAERRHRRGDRQHDLARRAQGPADAAHQGPRVARGRVTGATRRREPRCQRERPRTGRSGRLTPGALTRCVVRSGRLDRHTGLVDPGTHGIVPYSRNSDT